MPPGDCCLAAAPLAHGVLARWSACPRWYCGAGPWCWQWSASGCLARSECAGALSPGLDRYYRVLPRAGRQIIEAYHPERPIQAMARKRVKLTVGNESDDCNLEPKRDHDAVHPRGSCDSDSRPVVLQAVWGGVKDSPGTGTSLVPAELRAMVQL
eukprot:6185821-Pleurochrysis_carterae.AAC.1